MLNIDNEIEEVIEELETNYEGFEKVNFVITLNNYEGENVIDVVIHVDNELLEMENGCVIIAGDDMFEIQRESAKYARAIKEEFNIKSEYEVLLSGGLIEWYKEEEED